MDSRGDRPGLDDTGRPNRFGFRGLLLRKLLNFLSLFTIVLGRVLISSSNHQLGGIIDLAVGNKLVATDRKSTRLNSSHAD